jgi:hypothetical protein
MKIAYRIKRKFIRTFFYEQWSLLVCDLQGNILTHIVPPKDRFWADPFPVDYNGKTYIFVEEQIDIGNGTIGYIELYNDLSHSDFKPVLKKSYHLSYPYIFFLDNTWYMIPESNENSTIDLYRADNFPDTWAFDQTLLNIKAVDSTLFYYQSLWWLFTSTGKKSINANLSIYYTSNFPSDSWTPHPQNPIYSDNHNSRMAGTIFPDKEGVAIRPSQNCSGEYGREINLNKITCLNTEQYSERIIRTIRPEQNLNAVCTHTFNYSSRFLLRDIKTRTPK